VEVEAFKLDNGKEVDEEDLGTKYQYVPLPMGPLQEDILPSLKPEDPIFEELPTARVVDVSRSERNDHSLAFQLVYIIELQYKQFTWRLERKATQLLFLHLALKKRALLEDIQEKQEQIKEWAHNLGFGEEHPSTTSASITLVQTHLAMDAIPHMGATIPTIAAPICLVNVACLLNDSSSMPLTTTVIKMTKTRPKMLRNALIARRREIFLRVLHYPSCVRQSAPCRLFLSEPVQQCRII